MKKQRNIALETWKELLTWVDGRYPLADRMLEFIRMPHHDDFGRVEYDHLNHVTDALDQHLANYDATPEHAEKLEELKQQYRDAWRAIADKFRTLPGARDAQQAPNNPKGRAAQRGHVLAEMDAAYLSERGKNNMGIAIEVKPTPKPGHYVAEIASIEATEGKFGPQLKVSFNLGNNADLTSYFPAKATAKNRTGELLRATLGKLQPLPDSDILIGCKVNMLLEALPGKDYPGIKSMWGVGEERMEQEAVPF